MTGEALPSLAELTRRADRLAAEIRAHEAQLRPRPPQVTTSPRTSSAAPLASPPSPHPRAALPSETS